MNTYVTSEISFAAHLASQGFDILAVQRNGRKVSWKFKISAEDLSRLEAGWPQSADARFWTAYQTLKGQLRQD
jgi:hypothetical protein